MTRYKVQIPTTARTGKPISTQISRNADHMPEQRPPESADLPLEMRFIWRPDDIVAFQVIDDDRNQHRQSAGQPIGRIERVQHVSQGAQSA